MTFNVALIGYGYWGPKLARNIQNSDDFTINTVLYSTYYGGSSSLI